MELGQNSDVKIGASSRQPPLPPRSLHKNMLIHLSVSSRCFHPFSQAAVFLQQRGLAHTPLPMYAEDKVVVLAVGRTAQVLPKQLQLLLPPYEVGAAALFEEVLQGFGHSFFVRSCGK